VYIKALLAKAVDRADHVVLILSISCSALWCFTTGTLVRLAKRDHKL